MRQHTVQEEDLDDLQHVNNVRYLQWIQDIAKEHWSLVADERIRKQLVWVVLSHHIEYKKSARIGERLSIKTWVESSDGVRSIRRVQVLDGKEQIITNARTQWCLLSADTMKPTRISEFVKGLFE